MKRHLVCAAIISMIISFSSSSAVSAPKSKPPQLEDRIEALESLVQSLQTENAQQEASISSLQTALTEAESDIAVLQGDNAALRASLEALDISLANVKKLDSHLTVEESAEINGVNAPHVIFSGANVHIRSGSGSTWDNDELTGRGNLIIGYNEERAGGTPEGYRAGSHNLVIGHQHYFTDCGGFIAGRKNHLFGRWASVCGGEHNGAVGKHSCVAGGDGNTAIGDSSCISGGSLNEAAGYGASIGGGRDNTAAGNYSSVSGGELRSASGEYDWAAGTYWQDQ